MSNETPTDALRLVPVEPTREQWLWAARIVRELGPSMSPGAMAMTMERLAEKAAPASPLPGGGPYERWSILNHLGESWTPENFDTERQATAFLDRWKRDNPKMDLSKHKVIPVLVTMTAAPTGEPK